MQQKAGIFFVTIALFKGQIARSLGQQGPRFRVKVQEAGLMIFFPTLDYVHEYEWIKKLWH